MIEAIEKIQELKLEKSSWKLTKLGDLAEDISKRVDNPSASAYDRFVGLEHFVSGEIKIKNWGTTENLASSAKAFQAGDILFARRNAYLRRASIVDFDGCCSGDAFVIRENHNKVIPGFLAFLMNSDALWDYANSNAAGTMSKRVKWRDLAEYEFLLPPIEEQAKLAELLWAMDEVIEKEKEVLERLNNYFLSQLNSLFWGQKLASQKTKFGSIPNHWKLFRLEDISRKIGDGIHSTPNYVEKSNFRFINGNNIIESKIQFTDRTQCVSEQEFLKYNLRLEKGTILMSINGTIGNLGFYNGEEVVLGKSVAYITPEKNKLFNEYLYFLLQTKKILDYYNRELTGTTISNLSLKSIRNTPVPLAPYDEQITIANTARQLVELLSKGKTRLGFSQTLQKSLITQVFSSSVNTSADK